MIHPNEIQFVKDNILDSQVYRDIIDELESFHFGKRITHKEALDIQIRRQLLEAKEYNFIVITG